MTGGWDLSDDDVLLDRLADAIKAADPVPPAVVAAAKAAYEFRRLDEELATLVADSLVDDGVLVRHELSSTRLVSFVAGQVGVEVELLGNGGLFGAISPPAAMIVKLETAHSVTTLTSDDLGRFHAEVPPGRCRLHIGDGDALVVTPWITR